MSDDDIFRPATVADRMNRRVRDDHAANQALHDALKAGYAHDDSVTLNFMASHAPGEKDHRPRYEVYVTTRNAGMGHPILPDAVQRLVDQNDAKIRKVIECSDDELTVSIRPIETTVEPIEVPTDDIPDGFIDLREVRRKIEERHRL